MKQEVFFEGAGAVEKIGSNLKPNHCNQVRLVRILDSHYKKCLFYQNIVSNILNLVLRITESKTQLKNDSKIKKIVKKRFLDNERF